MPNIKNRTHLLDEVGLIVKNAGYRKPTPLQTEAIPQILKGRNLFIQTQKAEGKTATILIPLLITASQEKKKPHALILTHDQKPARKFFRQYKRFSARMSQPPRVITIGTQENIQKELPLLERKPAIIIGTSARLIDHIRRKNLSLKSVKTLFLDIPESDENDFFIQDAKFILSKLPKRLQIVIMSPVPVSEVDLDGIVQRFQIIDPKEGKKAPLQENETMSTGKQRTATPDEAALKTKIEEIVTQLKSDSNPEDLNRIRKLVRKSVPMPLRRYFCAAVLKMLLLEGPSTSRMKTLFVSVGKNRRVFPRDLAKHFAQALNISTADVGNVKVLDNYSFIEIPESLAEKAIETLNNREFRGKTISVNHAKKKNQ